METTSSNQEKPYNKNPGNATHLILQMAYSVPQSPQVLMGLTVRIIMSVIHLASRKNFNRKSQMTFKRV